MRARKNELDVVRDVSTRLDRADIAYMLTGSMAMNYYAEPRMTRDIDLVVALAAEDAETFVRIFSPDYYVSLEAVRESIRSESMFNLIHEDSVIKVDCIVRKSSRYRREEFARRRRITVGDYYLDREHGRPHPLEARMGSGFAFRIAASRRPKPHHLRMRSRLHRTLDGRARSG